MIISLFLPCTYIGSVSFLFFSRSKHTVDAVMGLTHTHVLSLLQPYKSHAKKIPNQSLSLQELLISRGITIGATKVAVVLWPWSLWGPKGPSVSFEETSIINYTWELGGFITNFALEAKHVPMSINSHIQLLGSKWLFALGDHLL